MRKVIVGFAVMAFALAGCEDKPAPANKTELATPPAPVAAAPAPGGAAAPGDMTLNANNMPHLAEDLNCVACHAIDKRVVGPAWRDVANKYKGAAKFEYNGKEYPLLEGLVMKVSKGGSGHWGSMPMPANDPGGLKKDKIEKLVKFELSLAK